MGILQAIALQEQSPPPPARTPVAKTGGYLHSLDYPFAFYLTIANKKIATDAEGVVMALRDRQLCANSGSI